jgi:hypothetical protein
MTNGLKANRPLLAIAGALLLLAGVVFWALRVETEPGRVESIAQDGQCRAPLRAYCAEACPSYAQALRSAREREPMLLIEAGRCGNLKWVKWSSGFHGETAYFGVRDELVCVEAWRDYSGYCAGESANVVYGERPDCEPETTLTLKAGAVESVAGSP